MKKRCVFCDAKDTVMENELAFAIFDSHPVSRGHTLVIPKRHYQSIFDSTTEELLAIFSLLKGTKEYLDGEYNPDGYNVGVNTGRAAGQSIMHAHVHVIPRYSGDHERPKGGVRGVIKGKQGY